MAMVNIPSTVADPNYRYKMPRLRAKVEGRGNGIKTNIMNMGDVAKFLKRPAEYVTKFCGHELCSQSKYEIAEGKAIVNGAHREEALQQLIDKFIEKFVACPNCHLPEIDLIVKNGLVQCKCNACGHSGDMDNVHKLAAYIVKNPPQADDSTVGKKLVKGKKTKQDRRAEKDKGKKPSSENLEDDAEVENEMPEDQSDHADSNPNSVHKSATEKLKTKHHHHKHRHHRSKRSKDAFDSPEIQNCVSRLVTFVKGSSDSQKPPTPADFFQEVRVLQVAQDFNATIRMYLGFSAIFPETMKPESVEEMESYISVLIDRSVAGENILKGLEQYCATRDDAQWEVFGKILAVMYRLSIVEEEAVFEYYSEEPEMPGIHAAPESVAKDSAKDSSVKDSVKDSAKDSAKDSKDSAKDSKDSAKDSKDKESRESCKEDEAHYLGFKHSGDFRKWLKEAQSESSSDDEDATKLQASDDEAAAGRFKSLRVSAAKTTDAPSAKTEEDSICSEDLDAL